MAKKNNIEVQGITIAITQIDNSDYISLTDIARSKNANKPRNSITLRERIQFFTTSFGSFAFLLLAISVNEI